MITHEGRRFLTPRDVGKMLGIPPKNIYNWARERGLPSEKLEMGNGQKPRIGIDRKLLEVWRHNNQALIENYKPRNKSKRRRPKAANGFSVGPRQNGVGDYHQEPLPFHFTEPKIGPGAQPQGADIKARVMAFNILEINGQRLAIEVGTGEVFRLERVGRFMTQNETRLQEAQP